MSDSELAHLKSIQLKDQQRTQIEAAAAAQAPAEEASPIMLHAPNQTLLAESPEASARTPVGKTRHSAVLHSLCDPSQAYMQLVASWAPDSLQ